MGLFVKKENKKSLIFNIIGVYFKSPKAQIHCIFYTYFSMVTQFLNFSQELFSRERALENTHQISQTRIYALSPTQLALLFSLLSEVKVHEVLFMSYFLSSPTSTGCQFLYILLPKKPSEMISPFHSRCSCHSSYHYHVLFSYQCNSLSTDLSAFYLHIMARKISLKYDLSFLNRVLA